MIQSEAYIRVRWSGVDWIGVTQDGEGWCLRGVEYGVRDVHTIV